MSDPIPVGAAAHDPFAQMRALDQVGKAYVVTIVSRGNQVVFRAGVYEHDRDTEWMAVESGGDGRAYIRKSSIDRITITEV